MTTNADHLQSTHTSLFLPQPRRTNAPFFQPFLSTSYSSTVCHISELFHPSKHPRTPQPLPTASRQSALILPTKRHNLQFNQASSYSSSLPKPLPVCILPPSPNNFISSVASAQIHTLQHIIHLSAGSCGDNLTRPAPLTLSVSYMSHSLVNIHLLLHFMLVASFHGPSRR